MEILLANAIETFDELLENSEMGAVEPISWFDVDVLNVAIDFPVLIDRIAAHYGGTVEEREIEEPGAYAVIWMRGLYFFVEVEPNFNRSFSIDVHVIYFRTSVDGLIDRFYGSTPGDLNEVEPDCPVGAVDDD